MKLDRRRTRISTTVQTWFILGVSAALPACTTLTKEECQGINWYGSGYEAAYSGRFPDDAVDHRAPRCQEKFGVQPDTELARTGYNDGLKLFCTKSRGMTFGRGGGGYAGTCSEKTETDFLAGYQIGRLEYVGERMNQLEGEVHRLRSDLSDKDNEISRLRSDLESERSRHQGM